MAYAVQTDIEAEFKGITFGASTAVTATQLAAWIDQESNYIDGKISLRYVTPVLIGTYPEAYSILNRICTFRVAERVKNKLEVKSNASQLDSEQKYVQNYVRTPNHDLEDIIKGNLLLKDVPLINSNGLVEYFHVETGDCHQFDTSKQQW